MVMVPGLQLRNIKARGNYRVAGFTGALTGAAANSDLVSFRWGDTTYDCVVWFLKWWWTTTTAFTAAQLNDHALYFARKFTASPSGGKDYKPAAGMNIKRTSYPSSLLTAFQISNTGALTVGTRTLDTNPVMYRGKMVAATPAIDTLPDLPNQFDPDYGAFWLTQDEGFVLQNPVAMGAGGVLTLGFEVAWAEVAKDSMFIADNMSP